MDWIQVFTAVAGIVAGGGLVRILTVRAERNKIIGEGEVSKANAAKTYHEISMDLIREARAQVAELKAELDTTKSQLHALTNQVKQLTLLLEEKDKQILVLQSRIGY